MTRLLVTGGRDYEAKEAVYKILDTIDADIKISVVIQGGAPGADKMARLWAADRKKPLITFDAHWSTLGRAAGPMRNAWMLEHGSVDLVVAFPGGKGTEGMVALANARGIQVSQFVEKKKE